MNRTTLVAALLAAAFAAANASAQGAPATPQSGAPAAPAATAPAQGAAPAAPATAQSAAPAAPAAPATAQGAIVGNAAKGRAKTSMCQGCHGIDGWRTAYPEVYAVPKLGNQHESYLVAALQQYKNGNRTHPSMRAIAASLSDQDMADLAAYYAQSGVKKAGK